MTNQSPPFRVTALYRFTPLQNIADLRAPLLSLCNKFGVKGTILLAREGINGTIAGAADAIDCVLGHIRTFPGCDDLPVKNAEAATMPFHRMKVRIKREIVTMGQPDIDPLKEVGHYVAPEDWNALIEEEDTILIDTRNDYEVAIGTFANAINPEMQSFRDFPLWFRAERAKLLDGRKKPKIAMFCTGGIRCEKATAFAKAEGLDEVYHLDGGILKYLETVPAEKSRWQGECFVFDQRVSVTHGLGVGTHQLCHACRMPISQEDRQSPLYSAGISCPRCHARRDDAQRASYAERERQTRLARARGQAHIGAVQTKKPKQKIKDKA
jgi:UPF0176 protein